MSQFPALPQTLVTRQVECVACRELFVVSEAQLGVLTKPRIVVNGLTSTPLRYQSDRKQAPIAPQSRSEPFIPYEPYEQTNERDYIHINCPRCGTDNRNWIKIRYSNGFPIMDSVSSVLIAITSFFVVIAILGAAFSEFNSDDSAGFQASLMLMILVAGALPFVFIPGSWKAWRIFRYERPLKLHHSFWKNIAPPFKQAITLLGIIAFGLPLLIFVLYPVGINWLTAVSGADPNTSEILNVEMDYLTSWSWYIGICTFVSSGLAILMTQHYLDKVDKHLPRPIFYSTANLTRLAVWEANRGLEIGEPLNRIQWKLVERNAIGGVELKGLYWDMPTLTGDLHQKVRAQEYSIQTDRWCRINKATVVDKIINVPANSWGFVQPSENVPVDMYEGQLIP